MTRHPFRGIMQGAHVISQGRGRARDSCLSYAWSHASVMPCHLEVVGGKAAEVHGVRRE